MKVFSDFFLHLSIEREQNYIFLNYIFLNECMIIYFQCFLKYKIESIGKEE